MSTSAVPASTTVPTLDYDELLASYQRGLVETLRGFGPTQSYLSLWVPDELRWKGIWNLFDAAASESQKELRIRVLHTGQDKVDVEALRCHLSCFGTPVLEERDSHLFIEILDLRPANAEHAKRILDSVIQDSGSKAPQKQRIGSERSLHPEALAQGECPYHEAMLAMSANCSHEQAAPQTTQENKRLLLQVKGEIGALWISVDTQNQQVIACGHQESQDTESKASLEVFCQEAKGRPIREVLDHGVERTEFQLRKARELRPISGIVLPNNAHSAFGKLKELVTALRPQCQRFEQSWSESYNEYDAGAGPRWRSLDEKSRTREVNRVFSEFQARHQSQIQALSLVRIVGDVRIHASLSTNTRSDQNAVFVARIEEELRDQLDSRLEVFLEQKRDQNKLRRLSVVQPSRSK